MLQQQQRSIDREIHVGDAVLTRCGPDPNLTLTLTLSVTLLLLVSVIDNILLPVTMMNVDNGDDDTNDNCNVMTVMTTATTTATITYHIALTLPP